MEFQKEINSEKAKQEAAYVWVLIFTHKLLRTLQNCSRNVMDERFHTFLGQLSEMNP